MTRLVVLLLVSTCLAHSVHKRGEPDSSSSLDSPSLLSLTMPGAEPKGHDSYLCTAFKVQDLIGDDGKIYVTGFDPEHANADKAHHMMLHTCTNPPRVSPDFQDVASRIARSFSNS